VSTVYLGLGSNIDPQENLKQALEALENRFGELQKSSVYRSTAFGFDGDDFLNMVVRIETTLPPTDIHAELEHIHQAAGRDRSSRGYAARTLDIDLLLYDDLIIDEPPVRLPRADVLRFSFVLGPLAEISPELVHPLTNQSMQAHWNQFDAGGHPITLEGVIL